MNKNLNDANRKTAYLKNFDQALLKNAKHFTKSVDIAEDRDDVDIDLINKFSKAELTSEDVYTFKIRMCDGLADRVDDEMTDDFLFEFATIVNEKSIPLLKDHCWSVECQLGRVYKAEVAEDEEGVSFVKGYAYVLASDTELVDKIKAGIFKEVSVAFDGEGVCSICGEPMEKDYDGRGHCKNGHMAGVDSCVTLLAHCKDVYELSFVSVPCQPKAAVIKKFNLSGEALERQAGTTTDETETTGGKKMADKTKMTRLQLKCYELKAKLKAKKSACGDATDAKADEVDEQTTELVDILTDPERTAEEITDEDIEKLVNENVELRQKNDELEAKIAELEKKIEDAEADADAAAAEAEQAAIDTIADAEIDKLCPLTPTVKENMKRDLDKSALKLVDGQVEGLADAIEKISKKYEGLFGTVKPAGKVTKDAPTVSTTGKSVPTQQSVEKGWHVANKQEQSGWTNKN